MIQKIRLSLLTLVLVAVAGCNSQNTTPVQAAAPVQADNTARNADSPAAQTPVDQAENKDDLEISAHIRKAILADESLSVNGHNVKVITSGRVATLRGPVKDQREKEAIEAKARQEPRVTRVDNFLEVK